MDKNMHKYFIVTTVAILLIFFGFSLAVTIQNMSRERDSPIMIQQVNMSDDGKININTCSKEALNNLPFIGDYKTDLIIKNRPYKDVYELLKIDGISEKTVEAIKEKVVCK